MTVKPPLKAINSTVIKNITTLEATTVLNTLGESNEITLRWIPAHCGYEGNELADQLAKRGSNNDRATRIKLPVPRCVCYAALRRNTKVSWTDSYHGCWNDFSLEFQNFLALLTAHHSLKKYFQDWNLAMLNDKSSNIWLCHLWGKG